MTSKALPPQVGPYSLARKAAGLIFVSGQLPIDPATGKLVTGGIEEQTAQVLSNIENILESMGQGLKDVIRCEIFLKDLNNFAKVNELYGKRFSSDPKPARFTVEVARLPLDAMIEIACIATS